MKKRIRLGVIASHFIQYQAPLWRKLALEQVLDLKVYYLSDHGRRSSFDSQFGTVFHWDIPLDEGYSWELLPGASGTTPNQINWRFNMEPTKLVLNNVADVYLRSDYTSIGALAFFYACLIKQAPVLYRGESNLEQENKATAKFKRLLLHPLFKHYIYALAIGQKAKSYVESLGTPLERISFAPYNVDTVYWEKAAHIWQPKRNELLRSFNLPENIPVVLFCGKVFQKKRPLDLAHALCRISEQQPISLLVAGTGKQLNEMRAIVADKPNLYTHFAGFVNQSRLPQIYAAADIICLPSNEPWGLVINEAMYSNCVPIVSEKVGCAPDLVAGIGEIHSFGNIDRLVTSLRCVLNELPQRKALIKNRISQYSLERAAEAIVDAAMRAHVEFND